MNNDTEQKLIDLLMCKKFVWIAISILLAAIWIDYGAYCVFGVMVSPALGYATIKLFEQTKRKLSK